MVKLINYGQITELSVATSADPHIRNSLFSCSLHRVPHVGLK